MVSNWRAVGRGGVVLALAALGLVSIFASPCKADGESFRVCADPNNLPFSNREGEGFENRLAQLVAAELGKKVIYTWWAQRRGFIRNTLKAGDCDVVMGVPAELDMVEATRPYYRSAYVFVSRSDRAYALHSIKDERLRNLSIGVQLVGNDGFNTPPAHALGEQGIVRNVVGYTLYGDYREDSPPKRIVEAVESGVVDVAAVWGPLAGYYAQRSRVPLTLTPIGDTADFHPLAFEFDIAVGVRKGEHALRGAIEAVLVRRSAEIERLLADYGVPLVGRDGEPVRPQ
jgi:mxaJ protein